MNHSVVLTPGQLINYDKKSERTKVQMVNTDDYISWIQNELTFDNDKLADIIINLNKWYGVDIECPSLKTDTFENSKVIRDFDEFCNMSDVIVANRMDNMLSDVKEKVYTRDIYFRD